jgi:hypothetical protein
MMMQFTIPGTFLSESTPFGVRAAVTRSFGAFTRTAG